MRQKSVPTRQPAEQVGGEAVRVPAIAVDRDRDRRPLDRVGHVAGNEHGRPGGQIQQGGLALNAHVPKELMDVLQGVVICAVALADARLRAAATVVFERVKKPATKASAT